MRRLAPIAWLCLLCTPAWAQDPPPAPSDLVNRNLPPWLTFSGEARTRFEGFTGSGFRHGSNDDHLLTRLRLNLRFHPSAHFSVTVQGQDARAFFSRQNPIPANYQDIFDLRLAYVDVGDAEHDPVTLRAGRQELNFGEQRLIGYNSWRNTAQSFDAIRLILRHAWARIDIWAAGPVQIQDRFNRRVPGNNLHGIYGALESQRRRLTVEPYLLWRLSPSWRIEAGGFGRLSVFYPGVHVFGKLGSAWDYGSEVAGEAGHSGPDRIRAWAGHWRAGFTDTVAGRTVRWLGEYNYSTGDRDPRDRLQEGFTAPYPSLHDRYGLADQVGWKNLHHLRTGAEIRIAPRWELVPNIHNYWLASQTDGLFTPSNLQLARVESGAASHRVGWEADLSAQWTIRPGLRAGFGFSHLFPGAFLRQATPGVPYTFSYCMLDYKL